MQVHSILSTAQFYLTVALVFIVMISILVFAHELGHYLFARLFNMGVEEFAIGFGKKPIIVYAKRDYRIKVLAGEDPHLPHSKPADDLNEQMASLAVRMEGSTPNLHSNIVEGEHGVELHETTHFTVRPIPAGGFVRIKGMLPEEDGSEVRIPGGFYSKAPWKRFIVLLAGPAFSVLAGILILVPTFMSDGITKFDPHPILGQVTPGRPADQAGLRQGDKIIALNERPIHSFFEMIQVVRVSAGVKLLVTYQRD